MKILTIVGTRPELIKLSRVLSVLELYSEHILVHTGQNFDYELNQVFFDQLMIKKPDYFLKAAGKNAAESIANIISKSDEVLEKEQPDAVLIYGDTNSCLSALSAKRRKIPVFHMEAGNRCFDLRVPEEINRKIIDHLSDINMVISEQARHHLMQEGIRPETIVKTGSSMKEVLDYHAESISNSNVLKAENLSKDSYILVSIHREENVDVDLHFDQLLNVLISMAQYFKKRIIVSTHPRTRIKLSTINFKPEEASIEFMKPFGFFEYIHLQQNAFCVVSDSGTITEEASLLRFPAITIRQAHERPEGMDEGTVIMSGLDTENILNAIKIVTDFAQKNIHPEIVADYNVNNVSMKVLKVIMSYTGYINRTVWKKNVL